MNIQSTALIKAPKSPVVRSALEESTAATPSLLILSAPHEPNYVAGARAYRNKRLRSLTKSMSSLAGVTAAQLFPTHKAAIDGLTFLVGSGVELWRVLEDGAISPGETIDLGCQVLGGAVAYRNLSPVIPTHGPDDGLRSPKRIPTALDGMNVAFGMIARAHNSHIASITPVSPYAFAAKDRDTFFADIAGPLGRASPAAAAFTNLLDVLFDEHFWKSFDLTEPPVNNFVASLAEGRKAEGAL